jgi:hypothetical protein
MSQLAGGAASEKPEQIASFLSYSGWLLSQGARPRFPENRRRFSIFKNKNIDPPLGRGMRSSRGDGITTEILRFSGCLPTNASPPRCCNGRRRLPEWRRGT